MDRRISIGKNVGYVTGINKIPGINSRRYGTIHAEVDACIKMAEYIKRIKVRTVDILIIRVTKTEKYCSSRPCFNCLRTLKKFSKKNKINIRNIYYTTKNENIIKEKFVDIFNGPRHYSKGYSR
jgi:deoxycytidylate deaminase